MSTARYESDRRAVERAEAQGMRDGRSRRPYHSPRLSALGDVRDVTLGGSPGMGDTQNPMTEGNIPFYGDYIIVP